MCAVGDAGTEVRGYMWTESVWNSSYNSTLGVNNTYIDGYYVPLHTIIVPIIFSIVVLLGILGNLLVCYVIFSKPQLRTVTNLLLLNLSIADISFLLVCGSFTVVHYALTVWPFGDVLCRIIQYLLYVTCYVTMYTLVAVSFVRCITIVYGPHAFFIRSKQNVGRLITAIWVIFLVAKIPILVVHGVSHNEATNRTECIISGRKDAQKLFATFFVFAYALPLFIICTMYAMAVCHLRRHRTLMHSFDGSNNHRPGRARHVTKVVTLVVMVFAICWLPLHIHLLVAYYGSIPRSPIYQIFLLVWHCLSYTNSLLNPIIYNVFSKEFRTSFIEAIFCRKPQTHV